MSRQLSRGISFAFVSLLASGLAAQTLTVQPSPVLTAGDVATIRYSQPGMAGKDIVVKVSGGFPVPSTETVVIHLDKNGEGSATWIVNGNWSTARFNGGDAPEVSLPIKH